MRKSIESEGTKIPYDSNILAFFFFFELYCKYIVFYIISTSTLSSVEFSVYLFNKFILHIVIINRKCMTLSTIFLIQGFMKNK